MVGEHRLNFDFDDFSASHSLQRYISLTLHYWEKRPVGPFSCTMLLLGDVFHCLHRTVDFIRVIVEIAHQLH